MPLESIPVTADSAAEQAARGIINQITATAQRISQLRRNGIPASPGQPASVGPQGRPIPAIEATPAVSPADIDAKLGSKNVAILDALTAALA